MNDGIIEGTRRRRRSTSNYNADDAEVERRLRDNEEAQRAADPELHDMRVNDEEEEDSGEDASDMGAMSEDEDDDNAEYDESDKS